MPGSQALPYTVPQVAIVMASGQPKLAVRARYYGMILRNRSVRSCCIIHAMHASAVVQLSFDNDINYRRKC